MTYRIKNWKKFQHFKDRRPPWIKLYRDILDNLEWFRLPDASKGVLVMLWLIASEDKTSSGYLPDIKTLSFRLRMTEKNLNNAISTLSSWLEHDDISVISERYQDGSPETERETEKEGDLSSPGGDGFEAFWILYPRKVGKVPALKAWKKLKPDQELKAEILKAVALHRRSEDWTKDGGQFIPHPATWINQQRWQDELKVAARAPAYDPDRMKAKENELKRIADREYERLHQKQEVAQ